MMAQIENPQLTIESLGILEKKIELNTAMPEDYKRLDGYLTSIGLKPYVIEVLKEYEFNSYEEYILERKKSYELKERITESTILGTILGIISGLKKYIQGKAF